MADGNVPLEDVFVAITDLVQAELRTNLNDSTTKSKLSRAMWDGVAFFGAGSPATLLEPHLSNYFSQLDASDLADYQAGGYIKRLFQHSMDAQGHMPKLDGERSVQTELFSSLFVAVRTSIWARKDRNRSVRSRSWEVRSDSGDKEGRTDYFLTINGKVRAAFELKRYEVLPNDQMEMACLALQSGGVTVSKDKIKWASTDLVERISFKTRGTIAHALSQILVQFQTLPDVRFLVFSNASRFILFERRASKSIAVYNMVGANGAVTPQNPVGNAYMLMMGLSTLPIVNYDTTPLPTEGPVTTVPNVVSRQQGPTTRAQSDRDALPPFPPANPPPPPRGTGGSPGPTEGCEPSPAQLSYSSKRPAALDLTASQYKDTHGRSKLQAFQDTVSSMENDPSRSDLVDAGQILLVDHLSEGTARSQTHSDTESPRTSQFQLGPRSALLDLSSLAQTPELRKASHSLPFLPASSPLFLHGPVDIAKMLSDSEVPRIVADTGTENDRHASDQPIDIDEPDHQNSVTGDTIYPSDNLAPATSGLTDYGNTVTHLTHDEQHSVQASGTNQASKSVLMLDHFLAYGSCWDVFRGHYVNPDSPSSLLNQSPLVVKICSPSGFPSQSVHYDRSGGFTDLDARRSILKEIKALHLLNQLSDNSYTPTLHALYGARYDDNDCWVAVMEDVRSGMSRDQLDQLSWDEKELIVNMYEAFHSVGVVHNDPDPRHWTMDKSGSGRGPICIDFGTSLFKEDARFESPDDPEQQWSEWTSEEILNVKQQLGLPT